jgi:chromosome segregation ATPase
MICDLAKALAEETTERENLERELATVTEQRDRLAEAIRKHRDELELTSGDSVDRILWNALAAVKEKQTKDSQSCPECDALASHGCNDGPCETHKL